MFSFNILKMEYEKNVNATVFYMECLRGANENWLYIVYKHTE